MEDPESRLDYHPFSDMFPMMSEAELVELSQDIKVNGLQQPITRYEGKILDGRNRYEACVRARLVSRTVEYDAMIRWRMSYRRTCIAGI